MPRPAPRTTTAFADFLRAETSGGIVLLVAAAVALVLANSPVADTYDSIREYELGPDVLQLRMDLAHWVSDGLLAVFFFVAGLELKRELTVGELRNPLQAALPMFAALGGMVVPAAIFLVIAAGEPGASRAWAVPVATDIAFALGVLAVAGRALPSSLRLFLLSLAVVDDLGAIALIALLFAESIDVVAFIAAVLCLLAYAWLQHRRVTSPLLYVPLALATWTAVHAMGVHATIAGVALGLLTRATPDPGEHESPVERLEHRLGIWSAGIVVPLFALFAAGVPVDADALTAVFTEPVGVGIVAGLLLGKAIGVLGGAWLATRVGLAALPRDLHWRDLAAVAVLAGCGFTVSLLIAELSFDDRAMQETAKAAVLLASVVASILAALLLRRRARVHAATV